MYDEQQAYLDVLDTSRQLDDAKVQLESLLTATESLESIRGHLDAHGVSTEAHRDALMASLENLTLSTGLGPFDLLPSLEGHVEGTVSTESLKDRLSALWKRIVDAVMAILRFIKNLWKRLTTYRGHLRLGAETLKKRASARRGAAIKNPTIELGMEARHFALGGKVVTDADALVRQYGTMLDQYKTFTGSWGTALVSIGADFTRTLSSRKDSRELLAETCALFEKMPTTTLGTRLQARMYQDSRFGKRLVLAAPPVLGGYTLFFLSLEKEAHLKRDTDLLGFAATLRATGVRYIVTNPNTNLVTNGTVHAATGLQVEALANEVLKALDLIETQERSNMIQKIERQITAVLKAGERFQGGLSGGSGYDESVMRFVRNYASWATGPVDQMATNILSVSRSLLAYGRKSLAAAQ